MFAFTRIPTAGAPLGLPVRYAFASDVRGDVHFRLLTPEGRLLGAKRFLGVAEADFDVAPYLRRAVVFVPSPGDTGLAGASSRAIEAYAEATLTPPEGEARTVVAPLRRFFACDAVPDLPALLGPMPAERLIAPGERDELTMLLDAPSVLTLTARRGHVAEVTAYPIPAAGLHLFRLAADDFPGAERIEIDIGGRLHAGYTLTLNPEDAVRLAWRTKEGSVEHYTFPTLRRVDVRADRRWVGGPGGKVLAGSREWRSFTLVSACELPAVAEALAGLLSSPAVWRATAEGYEPVEVVSQEAAIARCGLLSELEITIRPTLPSLLPWNC